MFDDVWVTPFERRNTLRAAVLAPETGQFAISGQEDRRKGMHKRVLAHQSLKLPTALKKECPLSKSESSDIDRKRVSSRHLTVLSPSALEHKQNQDIEGTRLWSTGLEQVEMAGLEVTKMVVPH